MKRKMQRSETRPVDPYPDAHHILAREFRPLVARHAIELFLCHSIECPAPPPHIRKEVGNEREVEKEMWRKSCVLRTENVRSLPFPICSFLLAQRRYQGKKVTSLKLNREPGLKVLYRTGKDICKGY